MIVRRLVDTIGTDREVETDQWASRRLLLRADRMGFSLHDTVIRAGARLEMQYLNHLEAVYCIEGRGTVTIAASGEVVPIAPGTVYALDVHDEHVLAAETEMRMVCVFNPPLTGREVHDERGAYPLLEDDAPPDDPPAHAGHRR